MAELNSNTSALRKVVKIKEELPLIPLRDLVVFPRAAFSLIVKRKKSLEALDFAIRHNRVTILVAQKKKETEDPKPNDLFEVGTIVKIREVIKMPDGTVKAIVEGIVKAKIKDYLQEKSFFKAKIQPIPEPKAEKTDKIQALRQTVLNQFRECVALGAMVPLDILLTIINIREPVPLVDLIVINLDFKVEEKQQILEARGIEEKLKKLSGLLDRRKKILKVAKKLEVETGKELGKMQKEVYLREQLKAIEKELGIDGEKGETAGLEEKIKKAGMPKEVESKALKELSRLQRMPSFSPEVSWVRTYLDHQASQENFR